MKVILLVNLVKHLLKIVKNMQLLFQKLNLDVIMKVFIHVENIKFELAFYSVSIHLNH